MSLRAFHILFITLCSLLALGSGVLNLLSYREQQVVWQLVVSILSFVAVPTLIIYGVRFIRKTRNIIL